MAKLRDITASFAINNSDAQNIDTSVINNNKENLLVSQANDFILQSISPLIKYNSNKGEFFAIIGIPEDIKQYVIEILTYNYFYNVSAINGGYKIDWESVTYYKLVDYPDHEDLEDGLYYLQKVKKSYSTINIYEYIKAGITNLGPYYTKEYLKKQEVI